MRDPKTDLTWPSFVLGLVSDPQTKSEDLAKAWEQAGEPLEPTVQAIVASIHQRIHAERRHAATVDQAQLRIVRNKPREAIAGWSIEKIRTWLEQALAGGHGPAVTKLATAFYCKRDVTHTLTDAEARALVSDILSVRPDDSKHDEI